MPGRTLTSMAGYGIWYGVTISWPVVGGCSASELSQHLSERSAALRDRIFGRLFDVAEYARLDDEERKNYVEAMNTARDTYNQIAYARNKGIEIGRASCRERV